MKNSRLLLVLCVTLMLWAIATPVLADSGGEKVLLGQDYVLESGDSLSDDLLAWGGTIILQEDSSVEGDVIIVGSTATVAGNIAGNLVVMGGTARVGETAVIEGDLISLGTVDTHPDAEIRGNIVEGIEISEELANLPKFAPKPPKMPVAPQSVPVITGRGGSNALMDLVSVLATLVAVLLVGALVVSVLPDTLGHVRSVMIGYPALSLGVGVLTLVLSAVLLPILIIICIGIPLAVVLVIALLICTLFGWVAAGTFCGQKLVPALKLKGVSPLVETLIGIAVITLLGQIPCLGPLFALLVASWGIGAVVLTRFGTMPDPWLQTARWNAPADAPLSESAPVPDAAADSDAMPPSGSIEAPLPRLGRPDTRRLNERVLPEFEDDDSDEN